MKMDGYKFYGRNRYLIKKIAKVVAIHVLIKENIVKDNYIAVTDYHIKDCFLGFTNKFHPKAK